MMKKMILMVVAIVMVVGTAFLVTGCGNDSDDTADKVTETSASSEESSTADAPATSELAGDYQDSVSQRATMTIEFDSEDNEYEISVIWSDSSEQSTQWEMDAELQDDRLVYSSCEKEVTSFDENGNETAEKETEQGSGYFEIDEQGKILWTGASDSECQSCVFEKTTP